MNATQPRYEFPLRFTHPLHGSQDISVVFERSMDRYNLFLRVDGKLKPPNYFGDQKLAIVIYDDETYDDKKSKAFIHDFKDGSRIVTEPDVMQLIADQIEKTKGTDVLTIRFYLDMVSIPKPVAEAARTALLSVCADTRDHIMKSDPNQDIYGFAGADSAEKHDRLKKQLQYFQKCIEQLDQAIDQN